MVRWSTPGIAWTITSVARMIPQSCDVVWAEVAIRAPSRRHE